MTALLPKIRSLKVWNRGGMRAPNKPLLLLLALGRYQSRGQTEFGFQQIETELRTLLREFGPCRKSYHPQYPFWRLQNDKIWNVVADEKLKTRQSNTDPPVTALRSAKATGSFTSPILKELRDQPNLVRQAAKLILEMNFPYTIHEDIAVAVGLSLENPLAINVRKRRDPKFRKTVLRAYSYACAICSFDIRLDNVTLGIEAAHIKWHQANGPDEINNGIALCSVHHKLFDAGAITLKPGGIIKLSTAINGKGTCFDQLTALAGKRINQTKSSNDLPHPCYIKWHNREVFRGSL